MAINDFEKSVASFQEKIDAKRILLEAKANEIKKDLSSEFNIYMKKEALARASTTLEGRSRYLLDPVSKDFPSIFNLETSKPDGDTIKVTNFYGHEDTIRMGSSDPGTGFDTYEIAKYKKDSSGKYELDALGNKILLPYNPNKYDYHRTHYAKIHNLPSKEYVTQEMLHVEAQKQTSRLVEQLYKGTTWADYGITPKRGEMVPYPKEYQDQLDILDKQLETALYYQNLVEHEKFVPLEVKAGWVEFLQSPVTEAPEDIKNVLTNIVEKEKYYWQKGHTASVVNHLKDQISLIKWVANQKRGPIDPSLLTGNVAVDVRKDGVGMYDRDLGVLYNVETGENLNYKLNTLTNNAS